MKREFLFRTLPICGSIVMVGGLLTKAGDLNPPAGPVAPTMKTLVEVEPRIAIDSTNTPGDADSLFKITQPGSYYLTGNITGVVGKHGIEIVASGVTLDLNGFDLVGVAAMGAFDGVSGTAGTLTNIAVVNGSVRDWGDEGVDLASIVAINCRVEGVLASVNTGYGILVGSGCTVTNCSAYQNGGTGIGTGPGSTVTNCSASSNTGDGITAEGGSTVTNCSAYSNTGFGINTSTGTGCTISNCSAVFNVATGIIVGGGSTVTDCTARSNTLDGIRCFQTCLIRGNTCSFNGFGAGNGAGIHATANINRIEGNNCTSADRGIDVDTGGNIIIKNTCSFNAVNWDVTAGNVCLVVQGVTGAAILGNTGGVAPGSTDPNANFTY